MISIDSVTTPSALREFIDLPYVLYRDNRNWIPPLRREQIRKFSRTKNPFFEHSRMQSYLARDASGRAVGRIAGIVNGMHLQVYDDGAGFFGFFECEPDYTIAKKLLDAAAHWLRQEGLALMRGPTNPSINETSGVLTEGFDRAPSVMMPYNPPYYVEYLRRYGFETATTMLAYYGAWKHLNLDRLRRGAQLVQRRTPGLHVRTPDMKNYWHEVRIIHRLYNDCFEGNWGHVPMTEAEFKNAAADMRQIADPQLIFLLERNGEPLGFSLSLPNINPILRQIPSGRLFPFGAFKLLTALRSCGASEIRTILLAVRPEWRKKGLDVLMIRATIEAARKHGYIASELSWVMGDNITLINALDSLGCVLDKKYEILKCSIG